MDNFTTFTVFFLVGVYVVCEWLERKWRKEDESK